MKEATALVVIALVLATANACGREKIISPTDSHLNSGSISGQSSRYTASNHTGVTAGTQSDSTRSTSGGNSSTANQNNQDASDNNNNNNNSSSDDSNNIINDDNNGDYGDNNNNNNNDTGNGDNTSQNQVITNNPNTYIFPDHANLPPVLHGNEKVTVDVGNITNSIIKIKYNSIIQTRIKILIDKDGARYTYDLPANGLYHWFPLQLGSGGYTLTIAENISGTSYMPVYSESINAEISNNLSVFLNPNQIVWYTRESKAVQLAWDIVTGIDDKILRAEAVHKYIISNISYDYERLSNVKPGYIPDIDQVLESRKGICFDYAALFASMIRALDIPAKLVMGYVSPQNVYHAWNEIYIEGKGWIKVVHANLYEKGWALVDATFDAGGAASAVGDGENYQKKYEY